MNFFLSYDQFCIISLKISFIKQKQQLKSLRLSKFSQYVISLFSKYLYSLDVNLTL